MTARMCCKRASLSHALTRTNIHRNALDEESTLTICLLFADGDATVDQYYTNAMANNVLRKLQVAGSGDVACSCMQSIHCLLSQRVDWSTG